MIQNSNTNVLTPKPTGLTTTPQRKLTGCYVSPSKIKNGLDGINPFEVCPSYLISMGYGEEVVLSGSILSVRCFLFPVASL